MTSRRLRGTGSLHGTRSRYVGGCRCDECREAHRAYIEAGRRERGVQPLKVGPQVGHGHLSTYKRGCRCDECRAVNADSRRRSRAALNPRSTEAREAIAAGRWPEYHGHNRLPPDRGTSNLSHDEAKKSPR